MYPIVTTTDQTAIFLETLALMSVNNQVYLKGAAEEDARDFHRSYCKHG